MLPAEPYLWRTTWSCHDPHWPAEISQADQVVGDDKQTEYGTGLLLASQLELTEASELLDPAKDLLDPSAGMNRLDITLVAGDACQPASAGNPPPGHGSSP
jgi:hypothetical protein